MNINTEEIERRAKNLDDRYKKLRRLIKDDPAKSASTMRISTEERLTK